MKCDKQLETRTPGGSDEVAEGASRRGLALEGGREHEAEAKGLVSLNWRRAMRSLDRR